MDLILMLLIGFIGGVVLAAILGDRLFVRMQMRVVCLEGTADAYLNLIHRLYEHSSIDQQDRILSVLREYDNHDGRDYEWPSVG